METRSRTRFAGLLNGVAIAALAIGLAATGSAGQVPLTLLDEPGALNRPTDASRATRPLSWRQKAEILIEAGVPAPARPPMQFALTPGAPARFPGGFLHTRNAGNMDWEASRHDVRSGRVAMRGTLLVILSDLKPNTLYVMDFSISGATSLTVYAGCNMLPPSPVAASFPNMARQEHALVVMPTAASGDACIAIETERTGYFYRVDISELGPTP